MPKIFAPVHGKAEAGQTFYQSFSGGGGIISPQKVGVPNIADGTSNTLAIVEADAAVTWTKPDDIEYDPKKPAPKLGGMFGGHFHAAFADGHVQFLDKGISEADLRGLITISGGEVVGKIKDAQLTATEKPKDPTPPEVAEPKDPVTPPAVEKPKDPTPPAAGLDDALKALQGKWKRVGYTTYLGGKILYEKEYPTWISIAGNVITVADSDTMGSGIKLEIKRLDATKSPAWIDWQNTKSKEPSVQYAVYSLEKDRLTIGLPSLVAGMISSTAEDARPTTLEVGKPAKKGDPKKNCQAAYVFQKE